MIIDFHTHAFPDNLAHQTVPFLAKSGNVTANISGTVESLITSMDTSGIEASVICTIATKPSHFGKIFSWLKHIRSKRLIPFPSIHPDDQEWSTHIQQVKSSGFSGLKMHPYYQQFALNEKRLFPLYDALSELSLILMLHCGLDIAYPASRRADPQKILQLMNTFPKLKIVATHMGGWKMWDEVEEVLVGKKVYLDTAFSLNTLSREQARRIFDNHPPQHLLFGSDSPWEDQKKAIGQVRKIKLDRDLEKRILGENAQRLLRLT